MGRRCANTKGTAIEAAIAADDWPSARKLIEAELAKAPKDHWLLSRLALTYYEERQYEQALHWDITALQEAPYCPLAIWGYAGTLDMLGRGSEALSLYRWLLSWGEDYLAYGECGEGLRRARSLMADCYYRIGRIWEERHQWKRAIAAFEEHFARRERGSGSIYPIREVRAQYKKLFEKVSHPAQIQKRRRVTVDGK